MGGWLTRERVLTLVLLVATGLAVYVCYRLALPFLPAVTWALALTLVVHPLHGGILGRLGHLLELELPSGPLRFQAAARHEHLDVEGEERYVLGVRVTESSERDRARLTRFLREAGR